MSESSQKTTQDISSHTTAATSPVEATKPDRRVGRTRKVLSTSLLSLLESTPWKNLTVQNIVDRANVGRSTFYSHFETKFDLLEAQLPALEPVDQTKTLPDFTPLFDHVLEHAEAMRPILGQPIGTEVGERMQQRLIVWWTQILANHQAIDTNILTASFLAGATTASMRQYLDDTTAASPQQMADSLELLVRKTLGLEEQPTVV